MHSVAVSAAELRDAQLAGRLPAAAAAHLLLASLRRWHWLEMAVQVGVHGKSAHVLLQKLHPLIPLPSGKMLQSQMAPISHHNGMLQRRNS